MVGSFRGSQEGRKGAYFNPRNSVCRQKADRLESVHVGVSVLQWLHQVTAPLTIANSKLLLFLSLLSLDRCRKSSGEV